MKWSTHIIQIMYDWQVIGSYQMVNVIKKNDKIQVTSSGVRIATWEFIILKLKLIYRDDGLLNYTQ